MSGQRHFSSADADTLGGSLLSFVGIAFELEARRVCTYQPQHQHPVI